jgi:hypothetical protein
MATLISSYRCCATCSHWCGHSSGNALGNLVTYSSGDSGLCSGGGMKGAAMPALGSCSHWTKRF